MAKSRRVTTKNFDACKVKSDELNDSFDSFDINGKRCEDIAVQCNKLKVKMDPIIKDLKKATI